MGKKPFDTPFTPLTPPPSISAGKSLDALLELFRPSPKIFTQGYFPCNHLLLVYRQGAGKGPLKGEPHIKAPALVSLGDSAGTLSRRGWSLFPSSL